MVGPMNVQPFRLILQDLDLQVVGEAADWPTVLALAHATRPDLVVVDWDLVADESGAALPKLRESLPCRSSHRLNQPSGSSSPGRSLGRSRCVYQ
jgi:DNA-binding NarL/FixJ family response regulator